MAETAAGAVGRGHMRASHADREQVIDLLKASFVQGRLAKDEFDLRVGQVLTSRTVAELAALTADVPAALILAEPGAARRPRLPARRGPDKNRVTTLACVTTGAVSLFALPYAVTVLTNGDRPHAQTVIFLIVMFTVFVMPLTAVLLRARLSQRGARPSTQRPPVTTNRALS